MLRWPNRARGHGSDIWPDGEYRCVTFADAVGLNQGLVRSCYMTVIKNGDASAGRLQRHRAGDAVLI